MTQHQETAHGTDHDYVAGSPHLKHPRLNEKLTALLTDALGTVADRDLERSVLDIGAGDGAFVTPMLDDGWRVTATEMSRPAVERLRAKYGQNPAFAATYDQDGSLAPLGDRRFSLILYASVLHHIPDYLTAIERAVDDHLAPEGTFVSLQDPLWYPSMRGGAHALSEAAFMSWRLSKGNYLRGIRSRIRRMRGTYDDSNPSDTVEYHVVREGVEQDAIRKLLETRFTDVRVVEYWSTQARIWQWAGDALPLSNTFAIIAEGFRGRGRPD